MNFQRQIRKITADPHGNIFLQVTLSSNMNHI